MGKAGTKKAGIKKNPEDHVVEKGKGGKLIRTRKRRRESVS